MENKFLSSLVVQIFSLMVRPSLVDFIKFIMRFCWNPMYRLCQNCDNSS